jgi:hypothetical protein
MCGLQMPEEKRSNYPDIEAFCEEFKVISTEHKNIDARVFNNDAKYKGFLNQVGMDQSMD